VKSPVLGVVAPTVPLMLMEAVPVRFVTTPDAGVPKAGVTKVGEVANTKAPVPVSSVTAVRRLADEGVAKKVATPAPKPEMPVATGKPVALVRVALDGVPSAGVTSVGLVANTKAPVPVSPVTAAARLAEDGVAKNVATPDPRPLTPVLMGRPVALVKVALEGVPKAGVTNVGLVANTAKPEPVSSVKAPASCADVNDPSEVALPTDVTAPVKLALVVTLPAVRPAAVPVMFVPTSAEGVPKAGVTSVGLVANTNAPVPVSSVTAAARFALEGVARKVATPEPRPLTPVEIGRPVAFVKVALDGVPRAGVTSVGLLANTKAPVPVSSDTAAAKFAELGVPKKVATPAPKLVIPVPPLATGKVPVTPVVKGNPVAFVKVADDGVPRAGVTSVGLLDRTLFPVPVEVPTPVPPFVTLSNGPASNSESMVSRSALSFVPQESVDAPTSGLVNNKFVVVVSAIFYLMRQFSKIKSWSN